jgi:hypothetical protein
MFRQVVGSLFALAGKYADQWSAVDRVVDPPTFGLRAAFSVEPVNVSLTRLTWKFVEGYVRHQGLWREVMAEETFGEVLGAIEEASERPGGMPVTAELWIRIVYDFLVAYNSRRVDSGPLLDALIPLYFARTAAFVHEVAELTNEKAEEAVDDVVDAAIRLKPTLRARWRKEGVPERSLAEHSVPEGEPVEELASGSV